MGLSLHGSDANRVRMGYGTFWKVLEIDNAIFQELESFGKREVFQNVYGKVLDFGCGQFLSYPEVDIT